ncbi:hypothetical protein Sjap_016087 [Stephania japonica]|uniref:GDPGP1-like C-terminal domain-containing protein n=1 Tax=Stephania japonica TaxID=461633 RepID=A0AAP0IKV6_9MAGN
MPDRSFVIHGVGDAAEDEATAVEVEVEQGKWKWRKWDVDVVLMIVICHAYYPVVLEISVHIVSPEEAELQEAYKRNAWHLLAEVSLSEECFKEVKTFIFGAFQAWKKNLNWT